MSNKQPVMSHDPLADLDESVTGEVVQVPEEAVEANAAAAEASAQGGDKGRLVLESSLTIADVGEYHGVMSSYLEGGEPLTIDGSRVDAVDGAGLQLLSAFVKELIQKGTGVTWDGASETLLRAAQHMGVSSTLQLDQMDEAA